MTNDNAFVNRELLDRARDLGARESGLAVVVTIRVDGSAQASVANVGVPTPDGGTRRRFSVARGQARKLVNMRHRPRATVVFRSGWDWVTVEGQAQLAGPDDAIDGLDLSRPPETVAGLNTPLRVSGQAVTTGGRGLRLRTPHRRLDTAGSDLLELERAAMSRVYSKARTPRKRDSVDRGSAVEPRGSCGDSSRLTRATMTPRSGRVSRRHDRPWRVRSD